jgi:hypothetical protein
VAAGVERGEFIGGVGKLTAGAGEAVSASLRALSRRAV